MRIKHLVHLTDPDLKNITDIIDSMKIHHKSNIDFSESGLKAASATVIEIIDGAAFIYSEQTLDIVINRPFMFVLREKNSNTILFLGTVYNPTLWEDDEDNYQYI